VGRHDRGRVAAACYGIYFNMPPRMLAWPVAVGLLAHTVRWVALSAFDASVATATLVACLFAGLVITPVAHRWRLPFAAIGFASVVSMMPGSYLMRTAGGLVQLADGSHTTLALISGTIADGATATIVILAICLGLIVPKLVIDRLGEQRSRGRSHPRPLLFPRLRVQIRAFTSGARLDVATRKIGLRRP
jgi:uncharacterized membrane protein YjjB (DUF3815 family)